MKTRKYLSVASILACSIAFSSCTKEENFNSDYNKVITELTATNELAGSRTMLNNTAVQWKGTETISVFNGESMKQFVNTASNATNAVFKGEIVTETANTYALYPYNASATMSNGVITTSLPNNQTATANSFADGLNISVAKATAENTLAFKNACGLIKFTLSAAAQNITFTAGSAIAGEMTITVGDDGNISATSITNTEESNKTITLSGDLQSGTAYYMVVPAGTYSNPTITVGSNTVTFDPNVTITIERGKIQPINITGTTAVAPGYTELTISSITEIEPVSKTTTAAEGGTATTTEYDRLEIVLSDNVTLSDANNAKEGFGITVTNSNGLDVTETYSVTNVELKSGSSNILILTLDKPVYTDDVVTVAYNTSGDFSGIKYSDGANWIKLTTAEDATRTMYTKTVYTFDAFGIDEEVSSLFNSMVSSYNLANFASKADDGALAINLNTGENATNVTGEILMVKNDADKFDVLPDAKYTITSEVKVSNGFDYTNTLVYRLIPGKQYDTWRDYFKVSNNFSIFNSSDYTSTSNSITILDNNFYDTGNFNKLCEVGGKGSFRVHLNGNYTNNNDATNTPTSVDFYIKNVKITEEALRPGRSYSAGNTHEGFGNESSAIEGTYEVQ